MGDHRFYNLRGETGHVFVVVLCSIWQAMEDVLQQQLSVITVKILDILLRWAIVISLRSNYMQFKCHMLLSLVWTVSSMSVAKKKKKPQNKTACTVKISATVSGKSQDIDLVLDTGAAVAILPESIYLSYTNVATC